MRLFGLIGASAAVMAVLFAPSPAQACGGTFCDNGPQSMPVDQSGENIIFVMDGQSVEAHIQIQYDPDNPAERFAWVVPLTAVPDFEVGSQQLFANTLAGTVPSYGFSTWNEPCGGGGDDGWCDGDSGGEGGDGDGDGDGGFSPKLDLGGGGPDVVKQEIVGAFEITVLQGGTAEEVMMWLGDNGYQQDPAAEPILEDYLAENYLFAAFKLANGAETNEIHPIVIRYDGMEPCVPIRLTQIAAQDDMDIRVFFLGNERAVPTNYAHVELNQVALDWLALGANYKEVVTLAIDEDMSDGHGFVTEYAGDSSVIQTGNLLNAQWASAPFVDAAPVDVMTLLTQQDLFYGCNFNGCEYNHPLIESVVQKYLPVPDGVSPEEFYDCLECYEGLIDQQAWDGQGFADDMQDRVIDPGVHAVDLLETWPVVTRMYTTMSAHEMTVDPFFHTNPDLPDVLMPTQAQRNRYCDGDDVFVTPDDRDLILEEPGVWPVIEDMPFAERIEMVPMAGAPQVLVDNGMMIDMLVDAWNGDHDWNGYQQDDKPRGCGAEGGEGGVSSGGGGGGGGFGTDDGCGCAVGANPVPGAMAFGLGLLGLGLARRRRRH
jgi:MYXO-CTERM domain-containing protein